MRLPIAVLVMVAAGSPAWAQAVEPVVRAAPIPVEVEVGTTAQAWVGTAIGWFCDDPSLVSAALVTEGGVNYWVVEGRQVGRTSCRVGMDPSRASFVFDITVENPTAKPRG